MSGSTTETTVTTEEAFRFVEDILCMPTPSTKIKNNPLAFVEDLVRAWLHYLPFQNVKTIATPRHLQHVPTVAETKDDMFSGLGGMCYHHNVFCSLVLRALGFDVSLISSEFSAPGDHVAAIVHNLTTKGSIHYVDVGKGFPSFRAVPFDFDGDESPVYEDSVMRYKFSRQNDVIEEWHLIEDHPTKKGWHRFMIHHFQKYVDMSHFVSTMAPTYTIREGEPVHELQSSIICEIFPNGRFVSIKGTTLLLEKVPGRISKSYFKSSDELKEALARYFPTIPETMLDDALKSEYVEMDYDKEME